MSSRHARAYHRCLHIVPCNEYVPVSLASADAFLAFDGTALSVGFGSLQPGAVLVAALSRAALGGLRGRTGADVLVVHLSEAVSDWLVQPAENSHGLCLTVTLW